MIILRTTLTPNILRSNSLLRGIGVLAKASNGNSKEIISRNLQKYYSVQHAPQLRFSKRKKEIEPTAWLLLVVPIATFGLGTWQVRRKKWKEDLIHSLMIKTKSDPVALPLVDTEVNELEYRPVRVKGTFDHSKEMYLGPRSCLVEGQSTTNEGKLISQSANGVSGYLVVTPFVLSDTNERILVNRGWVPFKQKNPKTRTKGQIEGEVELEGIVRLTEPRPVFGPKNKLDTRIWFHRDVEEMAEFADTRPVFIDAKVGSTVFGGPIAGQTRASLRNEHFSYILTWYTLSAATAVMWYMRYMK